MEFVVLCVHMIFLRPADELAVKRVLDLALHQHRNRLVHHVADHASGQSACVGLLGLVHECLPFSPIRVRTRAMSRRTFLISLVLFSCWVASCMRNENCALRSSLSSL